MITTKRKTGDLGEQLAVNYLLNNKYQIVDRNYSCKFGEIDIIAEKDKKLYFIEVKTTLHDSILPEENITFRKLNRILKTIEIYLMEYGVDYIWQLDSISVVINEEVHRSKIRHLENINIR